MVSAPQIVIATRKRKAYPFLRRLILGRLRKAAINMRTYVKKSYIRKCAYCGTEFEAHHIKRVYCSTHCKDIAIRIKNGVKCNTNTEPYHKTCKVCGRQFDSFRKESVTCSPGCASKWHNGRAIKAPQEKACCVCGEWYLTSHPQKKTCGNSSCVAEYKRVAHKKRNERAKERQPKRITKIVRRSCAVCGNRFEINYKLSTKTCSKECSLENGRRTKNIRHDHRIPKEQRIDNITLKKLYKRDKGKCYLCGGGCDWNDWRVSDKGNKYPGDNYPTIEHVIPISRGGLNAWDNVRLAHWKCNIEKADGVLKIDPINKTFAYSEKYPATAPKRTAQYTLDGRLIRVWDSTADIRRTLGLNDKHIQNVCRGGKSKTGNAYGYHWEYIDEQKNKCG